MIHKKVNRILIMVLICIMLFNFTLSPVANAEPITLAAAWGGAVVAKEVLAMVVALAGAGITLATQDDAWNMYQDLKDNNQSLLSQIISVQPAIWTGAYNEVTQDLNNIKDGFVSWLTGLFGSLQAGNINTSTEFTHQMELNGVTYEVYTARQFGDNRLLFKRLNSTSTHIAYSEPYGPDNYWYNAKLTSLSYLDGVWHIGYHVDLRESISSGQYVGTKSGAIQYSSSSLILDGNYSADVPASLSATISADAPVLDGDYDAETDRRYLPPPYLGRYPAIEPKIKDIPTATGGTQKVYDGDIDEYIEDITNNATWEDLDQYIKTGANTTTLTPTAEGTLEVGEVITDGLPYPNVGTDAPTDVLTGLGGITGLLQGLTNWLANIANTIANIFTIPADLTLNFDSLRLLNFKDKFPFSIPWDIYRAIAVFAQTPQDPEIGVSLDTEYLDVQHQINLSAIDTPIRFARYVMSIFFILFLATKTRDLIKW